MIKINERKHTQTPLYNIKPINGLYVYLMKPNRIILKFKIIIFTKGEDECKIILYKKKIKVD